MEQLERIPRLVSCTESHATPATTDDVYPMSVPSHEMSIGEIASLFQQYCSSDELLDAAEGEDDVSPLLLDEEELEKAFENTAAAASRRESALQLLNARLSFVGKSFFVIPGDDLPDDFDEEELTIQAI